MHMLDSRISEASRQMQRSLIFARCWQGRRLNLFVNQTVHGCFSDSGRGVHSNRTNGQQTFVEINHHQEVRDHTDLQVQVTTASRPLMTRQSDLVAARKNELVGDAQQNGHSQEADLTV